MILDLPDNFIYSTATWSCSDETLATVDQNGVVRGIDAKYNEYTSEYSKVTITCALDDAASTVCHLDLYVVYPQPTNVYIDDIGNANSVKMKVGDFLDVSSAAIYPEAAQPYFYVTTGFPMNSSVATINSAKLISAVGVGNTSIVFSASEQKNYYAPENYYFKTLYLNVEPYFVKTMSLEDLDVAVGTTKTLYPSFTSDVENKTPTDPVLSWSSSNQSVATIDADGVLTPLMDGETVITVTTTSTQDGSMLTAQCTVNVVDPANVTAVGDYLLNDGTTSKEYVAGKTIGVVISTDSPRKDDTFLPDKCTRGIAVALAEGSGTWWSGAPTDITYLWQQWVQENTEYKNPMGNVLVSSTAVRSEWAQMMLGYNNTLALKAYISAGNITSEILNQLASHAANVSVSPDTYRLSDWYLPSVREMDLIYEAYVNHGLNSKLTAAGGTGVSSELYWTVNASSYGSSYAITVNPCTDAFDNTKRKTNTFKVRYIIAF